jgi:hypothetical protein
MGIAEVTAGLLGRAAIGRLIRWKYTDDPDYHLAVKMKMQENKWANVR